MSATSPNFSDTSTSVRATSVHSVAGRPAGSRFSVDVRPTRRHFTAGQVRGFGYEHVHDVADTGDVPAVSIHAYSPELTAMTRYAVVDRRLTVLSSERVGVDW